MVTEDCSLSVTSLQDLGPLGYLRYRPLGELGFFFFWAGIRGQAALLGLPFFSGPLYGRLFSNLISLESKKYKGKKIGKYK